MPIFKCKICGKLCNRSQGLMKVYPDNYDFGACGDCNRSASNED